MWSFIVNNMFTAGKIIAALAIGGLSIVALTRLACFSRKEIPPQPKTQSSTFQPKPKLLDPPRKTLKLYNGKKPETQSSIIQPKPKLLDPPLETIKLYNGKKLVGAYKELGSGTFGKVSQYKLDGQIVAIKMPHSSEDNRMQQHELYLLKRANAGAHPNIIKLIDGIEVNQKVWIILEFMQGSVRDLLDEQPKLSWKTKLSIAMQMAKGVSYLHNLTQALFNRKAIVHQDLKPANLLVNILEDTPEIQVKITDFGLARKLDHVTIPIIGTVSSKFHAGQPGGTLPYLAPEIAHAWEHSGKIEGNVASDIFSVGMILWELATNQVPNRSVNEIRKGTFNEFAQDKNKHQRQIHTNFLDSIKVKTQAKAYPKSHFFGPIIRKCIKEKPKARSSATEVVEALERISLKA